MTTYIEGEGGHLTGFKMIWTFDPMTTAYLFDGEDMSKAHRQQTLEKLTKSMLTNMLGTHYFTYVYVGKKHFRYQRVYNGTLTTSKGKATLTFRLLLTQPYRLTSQPLKLMIFDPTYYVDMSWKGQKNIILAPGLATQCKFRILQPHPTPAQVSYAMSIPPDADPDDTLGQLFTQSMLLNCQPAVHVPKQNHVSKPAQGK
jgi:tRNA threonylcarbamoyladenosine biosynthesis protein TsaE